MLLSQAMMARWVFAPAIGTTSTPESIQPWESSSTTDSGLARIPLWKRFFGIGRTSSLANDAQTPCDIGNHTFCYGSPGTITFDCPCPCHD